MSRAKRRGGRNRLKLSLTCFQVEVLSSASAEEALANHSERDRAAWQAIASACEKALVYDEARAAKDDESVDNERV